MNPNSLLLLLHAPIILLMVACSGGNQSTPSPSLHSTEAAERNHSENLSQNNKLSVTVQRFTITSTLCDDDQGPNCTKLRLGDDYLTTSKPAKGYLYSCDEKNPNAPGAIESKITWINFVDKTWNFLKKVWLPQGTFSPEPGTYIETLSGDDRQIIANNLPVDGKIGDWPMTNYQTLTEIDPNPGIPQSSDFSVAYPSDPSKSETPSCLSLGSIGITKNGVTLFNGMDGRGEDALAREIVDVFGGHPAGNNYHYHFIPERLDDERLGGGHSGIVGYINDGFPIYGYRGEGGIEMTNDELDVCHGHEHGDVGYHYHATLEYPYTVGCYMGTKWVDQSGLGDQGEIGGINLLPRGQMAWPNLEKAAEILSINEELLRDALGTPPPDLAYSAERLGVSEEQLRLALESSR